jgi:hypothetical protein
MPDYYIFKAPTCACGDDPVRIPEARRHEGLEQRAHWCTGTLRMTDGFGNPKYIFNPLTYDALCAALDGIASDSSTAASKQSAVDQYLECISMRGQLNSAVDDESSGAFDDSERCSNLRPKVPVLDEQQISPIAVLESCKSNYQQKQWDAGAFLLYERGEVLSSALTGLSSSLPSYPADDAVGQCLLQAERNKESNLACMQSYLRDAYASESLLAIYWRYEKVQPLAGTTGDAAGRSSSRDVDACIVFSGPAKKNDTSSTTLEFRKCSHDYAETGCTIPHMVWSSSSKNKVPVATLHTVEEYSIRDREEVARARFAEAREMAMRALTQLENFTDANLEVLLFSGEGDALHQVFDCMVMGPMSRVDFWDRGVAKVRLSRGCFKPRRSSRRHHSGASSDNLCLRVCMCVCMCVCVRAREVHEVQIFGACCVLFLA